MSFYSRSLPADGETMKTTSRLVVRWIALSALALSVAGCDRIEKEYTYRQTENPAGLFTVHVKIGADHKLVMLEEFKPDGQAISSPTIRDYFEPCQYFDGNNWRCDGVPGKDWVVMSHGTLTHYS
jgi:hypothetical protein